MTLAGYLFAGQGVPVTGAAGGMGLETARACAALDER